MARTAVTDTPAPVRRRTPAPTPIAAPLPAPVGAPATSAADEAWRKTVSAELAMALLDVDIQTEDDMEPWEWAPRPLGVKGVDPYDLSKARPRQLPNQDAPHVRRLRGVSGAILCGEILLLIRNGVPPHKAAEFKRVAPHEWQAWQKSSKEPYRSFFVDVRQARAHFLLQMQTNVNAAAKNDGALALRVLENHFPKQYGRQRQQIPVNVSFSFTQAAGVLHEREMVGREVSRAPLTLDVQAEIDGAVRDVEDDSDADA